MKIALYARTQKEYNKIMKEMQKRGMKWRTGEKATELNCWGVYKEKTVIQYQDKFWFARAQQAFSEGYRVYTESDFFKVELDNESEEKFLKSLENYILENHFHFECYRDGVPLVESKQLEIELTKRLYFISNK